VRVNTTTDPYPSRYGDLKRLGIAPSTSRVFASACDDCRRYHGCQLKREYVVVQCGRRETTKEE
jgi:hypothetical protein